MKFVEKYLNKHHFFYKPHKWFLAFLMSPIHGAEIHYKKRYHLKFAHARKLFLFDLFLFLSIFVLIASTITWWLYDPTVTDLVRLEISGPKTRLISGGQVTYFINYQNDSKITLENPKIVIKIPNSFVFDSSSQTIKHNGADVIYKLKDLAPADSGTVDITGQFYGTPHKNYQLVATLSYRQTNRQIFEKKIVAAMITTRDSILKSELKSPKNIIAGGRIPISLTLSNLTDEKMTKVVTNLEQIDGLKLNKISVTHGTTTEKEWILDGIEKNKPATLEGYLESDKLIQGDAVDFDLTPSFMINDELFDQLPTKQKIKIVRPSATISANWDNKQASPGDIVHLKIHIKNDGDINLKNPTVSFAIPRLIIDTSRLRQLNKGIFSGGVFTPNISKENLETNESFDVNLSIPISWYPQGKTNLSLAITPIFKSQVEGLLESTYETTGKSNILAIGTKIGLTAEARYYTNEGDQLGRGYLPPQVNKETRYFAMINISNGTSRINNLNFSAKLPSFVTWTGKSSVSHGKNISYNPNNHSVSWSISSLAPHTTVGLYFELAITPDETQRGTTPILLQNINVTAHDTYIDKELNEIIGNINSSLSNDSKAQQKGVVVQ